jgi:hypothetical protein
MRIISTLLILLIIGLVVVGFYRGWFRVSGGDSANHSHVTMSVDQAKIRADKNKMVNDIRDRTSTPSSSAPLRSQTTSPTMTPGDASTNK